MHRAEVDDPPAVSLADHLPGRPLGAKEGAAQVDIQRPVPFPGRELQQGARLGDVGVVEQNVEAAESGECRVEQCLDLGDIACDQNDYPGALASYRECLTLLGKRGDPRVVVNVLAGPPLAGSAWGQPQRAARLLGAAEAAREQFRVGVDLPADRAAHERAAALVRARLGGEDLRAAWAAGRRLSLAMAIAEVQTLVPPAAAAAGTIDRPVSGLSPREEEVLRLLGAGQSDRQIAEALFISVRTAEGHVAHLLAKLGVPTRAAAVKAAAGLANSHAANSALRG